MGPLPSYAKINLGLAITGRRPDGYHTLSTIFQEISLADTLSLERRGSTLALSVSGESAPAGDSNLCMRAFKALEERIGALGGVAIHLEKKIPVGAGLGGGSSNAAALLRGVNDLLELGLSDNELETISLSLGADVPFFVRGGCQHGQGVGEVLSEATLPPIGSILLAIPPIAISTAWAYANFTKPFAAHGGAANFRPSFPQPGIEAPPAGPRSWAEAGRFFENDFESLVFGTYPEIGQLKRLLEAEGAEFASLSGSGSTVFGLFRDQGSAEEASEAILQQWASSPTDPVRTFLCHPIDRQDVL